MPVTVRVGFGYDVHRFEEGRTLFLGGVELEGEIGLTGHSDADVLLHALVDALLGAAALGDIGTHFPASDAANSGRSSADFVRAAAGRVRHAGYRVSNVDATVIAERPKLAGRIASMRAAIAGMLDIGIEDVSVKASTNNGLGALGAGEGIAAQAVVLIEREG
jgi:2-C-methyl-D-erythritol 2,4-cyclodiphosphate synthase